LATQKTFGVKVVLKKRPLIGKTAPICCAVLYKKRINLVYPQKLQAASYEL